MIHVVHHGCARVVSCTCARAPQNRFERLTLEDLPEFPRFFGGLAAAYATLYTRGIDYAGLPFFLRDQ